MFRQFLSNFTWLDICVVGVIARGCWIVLRKGVLVELFKIAALIFAIFIGLHFYSRCGDFFINMLHGMKPAAYIFSYVLLIGVTVGIFRIARDGALVLFRDKDDASSGKGKIIGLIMGFGRALLLSSLIFLGCLIVDNVHLTRTVRHSFTGQFILPLSPAVYSGVHHFLIRPVFPGEKKNTRAISLVETYKRVLD